MRDYDRVPFSFWIWLAFFLLTMVGMIGMMAFNRNWPVARGFSIMAVIGLAGSFLWAMIAKQS